GDALALSARQARAALAEEGVVALGQSAQELIRRRRTRRGLDFRIARPGTSVADILARARAEQHGLLRHQSDLPPQLLGIQARDIDAIDADAPLFRIVEAQQQLQAGA